MIALYELSSTGSLQRQLQKRGIRSSRALRHILSMDNVARLINSHAYHNFTLNIIRHSRHWQCLPQTSIVKTLAKVIRAHKIMSRAISLLDTPITS